MPCSMRLVMHRMCGRCFLLDARKALLNVLAVGFGLACFLRWSITQVRKPPVPQAGRGWFRFFIPD